jgi:hypothetical protein
MTISLRSAQLKAYEGVIEKGQQTFVEVGQALAKIREGRLFREAGFSSFDDYCQARWSMKKAYANHLIAGSTLATTVAGITNEAQVRELRRVPEPQRAEVMQRVQETGQPITAAAIRKVADGANRQQDQQDEGQVAAPTCCHCPVHCP